MRRRTKTVAPEAAVEVDDHQAEETMKKTTCHCIIRHALTRDEREHVTKSLEAARRANDSQGTLIAMAQLAPCPSGAIKQKGARS